MQLNDILEENSIKAISTKTKISEENLENLFAKNFDKLKKVKALGFISIMEREYEADFSDLREESHEYYGQFSEDKSVTLGVPIAEDKKGTSKFFMFFILILFATATWYFLTQFDKKNLSELIPFVDEASLESFLGNNSDDAVEVVEALKITKVIETKSTENTLGSSTSSTASTQSETITEDGTVSVSQTVTDLTPQSTELTSPTVDEGSTEEVVTEEVVTKEVTPQIISIVPVKRLWFGLIDMDTKERKHFSISDVYALEVGEKKWLIATSSAPFSLKGAQKSEVFNDAQEHYFKIEEHSVVSLSKSEYVSLGGWAQW